MRRSFALAAALLAAASCAHPGGGRPNPASPGMVVVPTGGFTMGWNRGPLNERPQHLVVLSEFAIDRTEVPAAEFAAFLSALGNEGERYFTPDDRATVVLLDPDGAAYAARPGYERHPANNVSWRGAEAFCRWRGKRLPTEAEWEKAARSSDARPFPWGTAPPDAERAQFAQSWPERGLGALSPVDAHPAGASPFGLLNMAGNVLEWVGDWYRQNLCDFCSPDLEADLPLASLLTRGGEAGRDRPVEPRRLRQVPPRIDPGGPGAGAFKVLRGGSWKDGDPVQLTTSHRFWLDPDQRFPDTGFRCARGGPAPEAP